MSVADIHLLNLQCNVPLTRGSSATAEPLVVYCAVCVRMYSASTRWWRLMRKSLNTWRMCVNRRILKHWWNPSVKCCHIWISNQPTSQPSWTNQSAAVNRRISYMNNRFVSEWRTGSSFTVLYRHTVGLLVVFCIAVDFALRCSWKVRNCLVLLALASTEHKQYGRSYDIQQSQLDSVQILSNDNILRIFLFKLLFMQYT